MSNQDRIKLKAYDLFMRFGVRSISMDEIATQLGISKKTIYQYYADKDDLVNAVVEIVIQNNVKDATHCNLQSKDPIHELFLVIENMEGLLQTMNPVIIFDLQKYHPAAFRRFEDHVRGYLHDVIKNNLTKGIELEIYRNDIDIEVLTRFRMASIFMLFNPDVFPPGKFEIAKVLRELTLHFLHGVATCKGHQIIIQYNQERLKQP